MARGMVTAGQIGDSVADDLTPVLDLSREERSEVAEQVAHEVATTFRHRGMMLSGDDPKVMGFAFRMGREWVAERRAREAEGGSA